MISDVYAQHGEDLHFKEHSHPKPAIFTSVSKGMGFESPANAEFSQFTVR